MVKYVKSVSVCYFFSIINQYRYVIQFSLSVSVSVRLKFSKSDKIVIGKNWIRVNWSIPKSALFNTTQLKSNYLNSTKLKSFQPNSTQITQLSSIQLSSCFNHFKLDSYFSTSNSLIIVLKQIDLCMFL